MKRAWSVCALLVFFVFSRPAEGAAQASPIASMPATASATVSAGTASHEDRTTEPSTAAQDLMQKAWKRYLEGSNLIKSGESSKARAEFNKAVDLILQSDLDISSTPDLNRFFQDLVRRIYQDESRYLPPEEVTEEKTEGALVDELSNLELIPIKVDPSMKEVVEEDLASTKYDIPIVLNERVLQSLNFWLNKGKKLFYDGLMRSGRYRDMIERVFREASLPLDVMYLAQVESLFKTNAVSRARARGIWQFSRGTAIRYGLKVNNYVDERSDPEKSTRAAALYLTDLYAMFKDWDLVFAAYNWGEGKVQRLIDRSGNDNFWELIDLRRNFPRETKNHIPLIHASIILARNPEKYGFPKDLDPPLTYDKIAVSRAIDLRAAAKLLGISLEKLKNLNPALRGLSTPAGYPGFELKVPIGTDSEAGQKIAALPTVKFKPPAEFGGRYKVQPGDTIGAIALRFRTTAGAIQAANGISSPRSLRAGTWLRIPSSSRLESPKSAGKLASPRLPSKIKTPPKLKSTTARKSSPK